MANFASCQLVLKRLYCFIMVLTLTSLNVNLLRLSSLTRLSLQRSYLCKSFILTATGYYTLKSRVGYLNLHPTYRIHKLIYLLLIINRFSEINYSVIYYTSLPSCFKNTVYFSASQILTHTNTNLNFLFYIQINHLDIVQLEYQTACKETCNANTLYCTVSVKRYTNWSTVKLCEQQRRTNAGRAASSETTERIYTCVPRLPTHGTDRLFVMWSGTAFELQY